MNDRFKFRAKRIDNNEFAYGFLCFIFRDVCRIYCSQEDKFYDCATKTLGQCTGLHDKNGRLIYEGDIVWTDEDGYGHIRWDNELAQFFVATEEYYTFDNIFPSEIEVIDNIHENPELLQEK